MARQVFHAVNLSYKGQPTISVTVDGVSLVSGQQMPSHTVLRNRRMELPPNGIGDTSQLQSTFQDTLTSQFEAVPESNYSRQQLFHYFEVQFTGTVKVELYIDGVRRSPNNAGGTDITLTVRDSRLQDIRRVYFPPLSYGWVPQLKHVVDSTQDGQILSSNIRALPARFSRGDKDHSEIQVTHQGPVDIDVFIDGINLETYRFEADEYKSDSFVSEKSYLPSGASGHVLQWIQTGGSGEVALFETDNTLSDRETPEVEV